MTSKQRLPFQRRVVDWMMETFSMEVCRDNAERNHRFLEEALELVQAMGCTAAEAHMLVDYTFGRPVGDPEQEVGGTMVTLAALCAAADVSMAELGERELARCWQNIDRIRAKQAGKPRSSPLPGPSPDERVTENLRSHLELERMTSSELRAMVNGRDRTISELNAKLAACTPSETKPPLGQEPWRLSLPVITVQMLADYGQEGFFEKTDQPVQGVTGVSWSSAAVDFACMLQGRQQERLAVEPPDAPLGLMYECRDELARLNSPLYERVWKWCQERQQKGPAVEPEAPKRDCVHSIHVDYCPSCQEDLKYLRTPEKATCRKDDL
jgi:hypothetical protein